MRHCQPPKSDELRRDVVRPRKGMLGRTTSAEH